MNLQEQISGNRIMNNTGQLNEIQLKVFNKVLNKLLSQNFPWWFEGIEIFRAGFNHGQKNLYMDGNIYVDADWIGEQWIKYNDYKPVPEFGNYYDDYSFGDLIGINDGWIDILKEIFLSVFNSIHGGDYPKYLSFSWLNVKPVETKKEEDMSENNFLKEHIKKVLREETGERTKLEKVITNVINRTLAEKELPENFHSVVVDVYGTNYGDGCMITLLMKRPYSEEESEMLFDVSRDAKNLINSFFKEHFLYGISISTSTIENYMKMKSD